ncbi:MAG: carbon-nitrogen hydrolase family protein [Gammaproteobacteria bacterium]|nr:carbon-nitrogen hydrolase family protein [Gammaproteobacteria bacterium]
MARKVSIAACQFVIKPVKDFDAFAAQSVKLLDQAKGADLVLFPELFTLALFTTFDGWRSRPVSELVKVDTYTNAYREFFAAEAKRRKQVIVAGSHLEKKKGGYFNVAYVYGPNGLIHTHDKTHIFPAESAWFTREGDRMEAFDLPFARVGFNVCYESEIPECAASLTEQGAEIILCPSYTFTEYGFWRVRHCAQARAIENQVYFVHCATGGKLPKGPLPGGWTRSSIVGPCDKPWSAPNGVIAEARANVQMVLRGTVDLDKLHDNRETGVAPTYRDRRRRADVYRAWPSHLDAQAARKAAAAKRAAKVRRIGS